MNVESSEELEGVAATVGTIKELGVEDTIADVWLDKTMAGIQALVIEIEAGGGAEGGTA